MQKLNKTLAKIKSKCALKLPLTDDERELVKGVEQQLFSNITIGGNKTVEYETEFCNEYVVRILDAVLTLIEAFKIQIDKIPPEEQKQIIDEYTSKFEFVEKHLSPMLVAADMNVKGAVYFYNIFTREEYVNIIYANGYDRRVCVTADSLRALVLDVMS